MADTPLEWPENETPADVRSFLDELADRRSAIAGRHGVAWTAVPNPTPMEQAHGAICLAHRRSLPPHSLATFAWSRGGVAYVLTEPAAFDEFVVPLFRGRLPELTLLATEGVPDADDVGGLVGNDRPSLLRLHFDDNVLAEERRSV